jgi:hypothetical protein
MFPALTPQQQLAHVMELAKRRGMTAKEYLSKYNPETDSLREFSPNSAKDTGVDVVVTAKKKHKLTTLEIVLLASVGALLLFILLKQK